MHNPPESGMNPMPDRSLSPGKFLSACAHALVYVMLFVGCQSVVVGAYLSALLTSNPAALTDQDAMSSLITRIGEETVLILLISNLLTILIVTAVMHLRRRDPLREMELYPVNPFRFPVFALFGAAANTFVSITLSYIPLPEEIIAEHNAQTMNLYGDYPVFVQMLSVAVIAGLTEELVFRGLVISRLRKGMGTAAAVIVSALIFGFAHGSVLASGYAALLGLLLGALYARYRSVLPGIIFHIFFNLTSFLLPEEGNVLLVLYILSVISLIYCVWKVFIRFPEFTDLFTDVRGMIQPVSEEQADIILELKKHQQQGRISAEQLSELHDRWEDSRAAYKKEKKYRRRGRK